MIHKAPNPGLEKKLNLVAYAVSFVVLLLVGMMRRYKIQTDIDFSFLPPIHASLNALAAVILVLALYYIKKGQIENHRKAIYAAMLCSGLFLVSYVLYHFTTPETKFGGVGVVRTLYFFLLLTHVVLAAVILPFILLTFTRAYTNQFERHKKMARWVFPIWLYVAVTGPICYLMLKPYY